MGLWGTILGGAASMIPGVGPILGPVVGAAVNGIEQSKAANKAGQQQIDAGNRAMDIGSQMYNSQTALLSPYRQAGGTALNAELAFLGLPQTGGMPMAGPIGNTLGTAGQSGNGVTGPSASYMSMKDMGAISDPNVNGGFAGQSPGTGTLGSVSSYQSNDSYGPKSNPRPMLKMKNTATGETQTVSAELVAEKQKDGWTVVGNA